MPARLILNADDFGLTPGVNRAIEELHQAGALTSATLMAAGPAFDDAVTIARRNPTLGVGCHIVLTDGIPVLPPGEIPSLLGPGGRTFRSSLLDFHLAVLSGRVKEDHIRRETHAQIARLQRAGIDLTHLDTHKHTHILPRIARALLSVAQQAGIGAVRNPFEEPWSRSLGHAKLLRRLEVAALHPLRRKFENLPQIRSGAVATTDGTIGISATGRLDRDTLRAILKHLPNHGTWELVTHPGYNDRDLDRIPTRLRAHRNTEREALLEAFASNHPAAPESESPQPNAPELIHYAALGPYARLRELHQFAPHTGHEAPL